MIETNSARNYAYTLKVIEAVLLRIARLRLLGCTIEPNGCVLTQPKYQVKELLAKHQEVLDSLTDDLLLQVSRGDLIRWDSKIEKVIDQLLEIKSWRPIQSIVS